MSQYDHMSSAQLERHKAAIPRMISMANWFARGGTIKLIAECHHVSQPRARYLIMRGISIARHRRGRPTQAVMEIREFARLNEDRLGNRKPLIFIDTYWYFGLLAKRGKR
jgi:hypothetical protein